MEWIAVGLLVTGMVLYVAKVMDPRWPGVRKIMVMEREMEELRERVDERNQSAA